MASSKRASGHRGATRQQADPRRDPQKHRRRQRFDAGGLPLTGAGVTAPRTLCRCDFTSAFRLKPLKKLITELFISE